MCVVWFSGIGQFTIFIQILPHAWLLTFIGFGIAISGQSLTYVVVASMYSKNL